MKKILVLILSLMLILTGCVPKTSSTDPESSSYPSTEAIGSEVRREEEIISDEENYDDYKNLSDPKLLRYVEDNVYSDLVSTLNSNYYFVENVSGIYLSKEYLEEMAYNSKENVYFGYSLKEIEEQFQDEKFVFTTDENGNTVVTTFEAYEDILSDVMEDVAIGTGTILLCVTVSSVSGVIGAPAISMIFAASAKTGSILAVSNGVFSSVAAAVVTAMETRDYSKAIKAAAKVGSEGFKWGAITGAITAGVGKAVSLRGASLKGLTMNEAAIIQKESKLPLDVIKEFNSMEQYKIVKEAGLHSRMINGRTALIRDINLKYVDENGFTNLQRMLSGKAPVDPSGVPYELHHIGRLKDSTLAILTKKEHMQGGNNRIWHPFDGMTENPSMQSDWTSARNSFWIKVAQLLI